MGYEIQMRKWLSSNRDATIRDAWLAGYRQCTGNWCRQETFRRKGKEKDKPLDYEGFRRVYTKYKDIP